MQYQTRWNAVLKSATDCKSSVRSRTVAILITAFIFQAAACVNFVFAEVVPSVVTSANTEAAWGQVPAGWYNWGNTDSGLRIASTSSDEPAPNGFVPPWVGGNVQARATVVPFGSGVQLTSSIKGFSNPGYLGVVAESITNATVSFTYTGNNGVLYYDYSYKPSPAVFDVRLTTPGVSSGGSGQSNLNGTGVQKITAGLAMRDSGTVFDDHASLSIHWNLGSPPGSTKESPWDTIPGPISDIIDYFNPPHVPDPVSTGGMRGLWDPNLDNGAGGTSVGYVHYIFDSSPSAPHDATLHYTTDLNSFSKFVVPTGLASGDTEFLASFNGFSVPVTAGQTLDFLSFVPGGVQDFELQQIDLGSFGSPGNPMDFTGGVQFLNPGATGLVMFQTPEPSSLVLALIALAIGCLFRKRLRPS